MEFRDESVRFRSLGEGQKGLNDYEFRLQLYGRVLSTECVSRVLPSRVELTLPKAPVPSGGDEWWPRAQEGKKPYWLKIDFMRWKDEDSEPGTDFDPTDKEQVEKRTAKLQAKAIYEQIKADMKSDEMNPPIRKDPSEDYLTKYNTCMAVAFFFIFAELLYGCIRYRTDYYGMVWAHVGPKMKIVTVVQIMDVLHARALITHNKWYVCFLQVFSRLYILFVVLGTDPVMQNKPFVCFLFLVYVAIEVIRYPFYALAARKRAYPLLTWLRYNAWIPLYPLGLFLEGVILLRSIPLYLQSAAYSVRLPNPANFAFELAYANGVVLGLLMPGGAFMVAHLRKRRLKRLIKDAAKLREQQANKAK